MKSLTGFFIILEQQIDVGDYIKLVNLQIEGTNLSWYSYVQLKSADGTVHFIRTATLRPLVIYLERICKS